MALGVVVVASSGRAKGCRCSVSKANANSSYRRPRRQPQMGLPFSQVQCRQQLGNVQCSKHACHSGGGNELAANDVSLTRDVAPTIITTMMTMMMMMMVMILLDGDGDGDEDIGRRRN